MSDNINWNDYIEKTENGYKIVNYAFNNNHNITSLEIPNYVTEIGVSSFMLCRKLESILLPDGLISIQNAAFKFCTALKEIIIPDSVVSIGSEVFSGCLSLNKIKISKNLKKPETFYYFNIENNVKTILCGKYIANKKGEYPGYWEITENK